MSFAPREMFAVSATSEALCRVHHKAYCCTQAASEGLHNIEFLPLFQLLFSLRAFHPHEAEGIPTRGGRHRSASRVFWGAKPSSRNHTQHEVPGSEKEMRQLIFVFKGNTLLS